MATWLAVALVMLPGAGAVPTPPGGALACTASFNETVETIFNPSPGNGEAFSNLQMGMIGRVLGVPDGEDNDTPRNVYFYVRDLSTDEYGTLPTQTMTLPGLSESIAVSFEGRFGSIITDTFLHVVEYTGVPATPYALVQTSAHGGTGTRPSKMMCNKIIFSASGVTQIYQRYPGSPTWVPHLTQPTIGDISAAAVYFPLTAVVGPVELPELIIAPSGTLAFEVLIPDGCCCEEFVTVQTIPTPVEVADLGASVTGNIAVGMPLIGTVLIHERLAIGPYSPAASQMITGPVGFGFCVTFMHDDDTLIIGSPLEAVPSQPGFSGRVYTYKAAGGGVYTPYAVYDSNFGSIAAAEGYGFNCASDYTAAVIGDWAAVGHPGYLESPFITQTGRLGVFYTSDVGGIHHCDLDGDMCTGDVIDCPGGTCVAGPTLSYNDNNACTVDSCDSVLGFLNDFEPLEGLGCPDPLGDPLCSGTCSCGACINVVCVSPSPSATPTPSTTPSSSSTPTPSTSFSNTPSTSFSNTPSTTVSASNTPSNTPSSTSSGTPSSSTTNTASATATPTVSNSNTPTNTPSNTASTTASASTTPTPTVSDSNTPTQTPTSSQTPSSTTSQSPSTSGTPTSSLSVGMSPSNTPSISTTASATMTPSTTRTASPSMTRTPTSSESFSPTPSVSESSSATVSDSQTPTRTPSSSESQSQTPSSSESVSSTPTPSESMSNSASTTPAPSLSPTSSETRSSTPSITSSRTSSATSSESRSATRSASQSVSICEDDSDCPEDPGGNYCLHPICISPSLGCSYDTTSRLGNSCVTGDEDFCHHTSQCGAGAVCGETVFHTCTSADPCNPAVCDPDQGCVADPVAGQGAACNPNIGQLLDSCYADNEGICDAGECLPDPSATPDSCDDGFACTTDICIYAHGCINFATPDYCQSTDASSCVDSQCLPSFGTPDGCVDTIKADGSFCIHPMTCVVDDHCETGACVGTPSTDPDACPNADGCNYSSCMPTMASADPATGCLALVAPVGTLCSDLDTACQNGGLCDILTNCVEDVSVTTYAADLYVQTSDCAVPMCDDIFGYYEEPVIFGTPCITTLDGICYTTPGYCDGIGGCQFNATTSISCDDFIGCTNDFCTIEGGGTCQNLPDHDFCALISSGDSCNDFLCVGTTFNTTGCELVPKDDGTDCSETGTDACSSGGSCQTGCCIASGNDALCSADPSLPCAVPTCSGTYNSCTPTATACTLDDTPFLGDPCDPGPVLPGEACLDDPICVAGGACDYSSVIDPANCESPAVPCLLGLCDVNEGCQTVPLPAGTSCSALLGGGSPECTPVGVCDGGPTCLYNGTASATPCNAPPTECSVAVDCTPTGDCVYAADVSVCETLYGALAQPQCTEYTCSLTADCAVVNVREANACSDGSDCTDNDACAAGECIGVAQDSQCDRSDSCSPETCEVTVTPGVGTVGVCQVTAATIAAREGETCDDADVWDECNRDPICASGVCLASTIITNTECAALPNPLDAECSIPVCLADHGCAYCPENLGLDCLDDQGNEGNACFEDNVCNHRGFCDIDQTRPAMDCSDAFLCTLDSCSLEELGCVNEEEVGVCVLSGLDCRIPSCDIAAFGAASGSGCVLVNELDGQKCDSEQAGTDNGLCSNGYCEPIKDPTNCPEHRTHPTCRVPISLAETRIAETDALAALYDGINFTGVLPYLGPDLVCGFELLDNVTCTPPPSGSACFANGTGICQAGDCVPMGGGSYDCDDFNPCTADTCDPERGGCIHEHLADFTPCERDVRPDPGDFCYLEDACFTGECKANIHGETRECPEPDFHCQRNAGCDSVNGCSIVPEDGRCPEPSIYEAPCSRMICDPFHPAAADTWHGCRLVLNEFPGDGGSCDHPNRCLTGETTCSADTLECTGGEPLICPPASRSGYANVCEDGECVEQPFKDFSTDNSCTMFGCFEYWWVAMAFFLPLAVVAFAILGLMIARNRRDSVVLAKNSNPATSQQAYDAIGVGEDGLFSLSDDFHLN